MASMHLQRQLPVYAVKDQILALFDQHDTLIIQGETGSGKTTQIPRFIYEHLRGMGRSEAESRIAVTQPRRVAAISLARRVSEEMGVGLGTKVGYSVRFEDASSPETCIKFVTDGMLLREILSDPNLEQYSTIILDEAHERTLRTDILFGWIKRLQKSRQGKPLKLIIMSATLDAQKFLSFYPK